MSTGYFGDITKVAYAGPESKDPLAFRYYNPDEVIMGKRMEDHLRFAVCYWHNFVWPGNDPFGGQTFARPWFGNTMAQAKLKADVAFEMFSALGVPYFCFMMRMFDPRAIRLQRTHATCKRSPTTSLKKCLTRA